MKNLIALVALVGLLAACGSTTTEPTVESVVVTGTVTLDGAPVASGSVELSAEQTLGPQLPAFFVVDVGSATIEAGSYRMSAEVDPPGLCASLTISVSVEGASGALVDTRRLGRCGEHVGVDFAF